MKNQKLFHILVRVQYGHKSPNVAHDEILSLLDGSELGVLDAPAPSHGDLLAVGESHDRGADTTEDSEHTSAGTLGKIIDSERECPHPPAYHGKSVDGTWVCFNCGAELP